MNKQQATERLIDSFSRISADWLEIVANAKGEMFFPPIWSTLFIVEDAVDVRGITNLITTDEEGDQVIADTGILAYEIDDELILGIDGAGYSFYDNHWIPLYDALGYHWHKEDNDQTN